MAGDYEQGVIDADTQPIIVARIAVRIGIPIAMAVPKVECKMNTAAVNPTTSEMCGWLGYLLPKIAAGSRPAFSSGDRG